MKKKKFVELKQLVLEKDSRFYADSPDEEEIDEKKLRKKRSWKRRTREEKRKLLLFFITYYVHFYWNSFCICSTLFSTSTLS